MSVAVALLIGARWAASLLIEYSWWKELGQVKTWIDLYAYSTLPVAARNSDHLDRAADRASARRAFCRRARQRLSDLLAHFERRACSLSRSSSPTRVIDNWTVLRFAGSRALKNVAGFITTRFSASRSTFYLFDLPFWSDLRGFIFAVVILTILVYWLVARGWQLRFHAARDLRAGRSIFRCCG